MFKGENCGCCSVHKFQACPNEADEWLASSAQQPSSGAEFEWDDFPEVGNWPTDGDVHPGRSESAGEIIFDDLPGLDPLSDESDDEDDGSDSQERQWELPIVSNEHDEALIEQMKKVLTKCQSFPGDGQPTDPSYHNEEQRFLIEWQQQDLYCI